MADAAGSRLLVEAILMRKLPEERYLNLTEPGDILAAVLTDPCRGSYLHGWDDSQVIRTLGFTEKGQYQFWMGKDWIAGSNARDNCLIPNVGTRVSPNLLLARTIPGIGNPGLEYKLIWKPLGIILALNVTKALVEKNKKEITNLVTAIIETRARIESGTATGGTMTEDEKLLAGYRIKLNELCREGETSKRTK